MANQDKENPTTGAQSDISKSQSQQQPPAQANQQPPERGERDFDEQSGDQAATGQAQGGQAPGSAPDEGLQGDTMAQQRTDIEGASQAGGEQGGFVGAEGKQDTSSELIEDEDEDFAQDGQGAPEGK